MSGFMYALIPIVLLLTAIILGVGLYSLSRGGEFARKYSNKLMVYRVVAQAIAIAVLMSFLYLAGK